MTKMCANLLEQVILRGSQNQKHQRIVGCRGDNDW